MNLEEIKKFLSDNKDQDDVKAYLGELSAPTVEGVEGFLDTDAGRKILQPRLDSNFTKGLNTWKEKNLEKLVDDEVKSRNPELTEEQKRIAKLEQELEQQKNEAKREKLMNAAMKQASEKGLPTDIVSFFIAEDEESTTQNITKLEEQFTTALQKAVDEKFKSGGRDPKGGSSVKDSTGATFAKSANEQGKPVAKSIWE